MKKPDVKITSSANVTESRLNVARPAAGASMSLGRRGMLWLALLVFVVSFFPRVIAPSATSICYDELAAKDSGAMLELLQKGDFRSEQWSPYPYMPFYKYVFGVLPQWLVGANAADPDDLAAARSIGALIGSFVVVVVFLIGLKMMPWQAAFVGALLYAFVPTILGHDRIAMHDAPSELLSFLAWFFVLRWGETLARRDMIWSAIFTGLAVTFYIRTGAQNALSIMIWVSLLFLAKKRGILPWFRDCFTYGCVAALSFVISVWGFWPYLWFRPMELIKFYVVHGANSGSPLGYWMGELGYNPLYYYFVVLWACTPPVILLAYFFWHLSIRRKDFKEPGSLALLVMFWVPLLMISFKYRASLAHYVQMAYAPMCLAAGIVLWKLKGFMESKYNIGVLSTALIAMGIPLLSVFLACASVSPYFLEYFNVLIGGGAHVTDGKLLSVGTYGEAIYPLFKYLKTNGKPGSSVICRLGPWPGLGKLGVYLGPDYPLHGFKAVDVRGPKYALRVSFERDGEFYRYNPDSRYYDEVMTVKAGGALLGDVWERNDEKMSNAGLVYGDDFATPQLGGFVVGYSNMQLNVFSDGKLYSARPGTKAIVAFNIPDSVLGEGNAFKVELDVQMINGWIVAYAGPGKDALKPVLRARQKQGKLLSDKIERTGRGSMLLLLEWQTDSLWDGKPCNFWNYDWIDAVRIYRVQN